MPLGRQVGDAQVIGREILFFVEDDKIASLALEGLRQSKPVPASAHPMFTYRWGAARIGYMPVFPVPPGYSGVSWHSAPIMPIVYGPESLD